jgi:peptidoglycan glycosyltransferase
VAGLVVLAATLLLGVNPSGSGPRLWLGFGGAYFQPSELLKLLMVVFLASYLADRRRLLVSEGRKIGPIRLPPLAYVGPLLAMFGLAVLLLAAQQDLGAAMLFFFTFLSMLYLATGQWGYVAAGLVLFGAAGVVGYTSSTRLALRVEAWLHPWAGAADWAFQIVQSLLAFGTGGVLGEGLGLGQPTFIPAVHTDFTFAALGESFGLVGILAAIALYGVFLLRGFRAAARVRRPFERFLVAGLTAGLVIQAWVIMGANVRLAPIAGVTLPFLSYGGSSLLSTFLALGLIIRVSSLGDGEMGVWDGGGARGRGGATNESAGPLGRTAAVLLLALALLAAVCGYWTVARADWLVAREDNPRRVSYEQRIVRGRIVDRDGQVLADVEVGPDGVVTRTYPVPQAAPVVGYANLRYGTGGIEAAFDEALRGEAGRSGWEAAWSDLLHRPPRGGDVRLTLDADLQRLAQEALDGELGAAVLLDIETGQVLAMASAPTFDPARLEERWEALREDPGAPLLNRATQGLYQPGTALQSVIVAAALSRDLIEDLQASVGTDITNTIPVDGASVGCSVVPEEPYTLASAYAAACPAPIASLGQQLGNDALAEAVQRWRLTVPPSLPIPTEAADWGGEAISSVRAEAIGQGTLTVSPLEMALVAATLANEGRMPALQLTLGKAAASGDATPVIAPAESRELLAAWRRCGEDRATGGEAKGHWGSALAGEGEPHAWFLGIAPSTGEPAYATAVLIERAADPERALEVGVALLQAAAQR